MMGRAYRRIRSAGQDVPQCNAQTIEFLESGDNLIAWPTPFPVEQAEAAWHAHRHHVLEAWQLYWRAHGTLPACFGERVFDGAPQISTAGLDQWTRSRIASIEATVKEFNRNTQSTPTGPRAKPVGILNAR